MTSKASFAMIGTMAAPTSSVRLMNAFSPLLLSLRAKQWAKNLLLYLPFVFTINFWWAPGDLGHTLIPLLQVTLAFALSCLLSSAVYLVNDVIDRDSDQRHTVKRNRPIALGRLSPGLACAAAGVMGVGALGVSFLVNPVFGVVALIYSVLSLGYSFYLKQLVIMDVMALAAGFVLRAAAGGVVIDVPISPWLYICTTLGALFLACGKRRNELLLLGKGSSGHREALKEYTPALLDQMIAVITPSLLISYSLYTFSAPNLPKNNAMMLTIPFVIYGIFRYLYLMHVRNLGGSPEDVLFSDRSLLAAVVLWAMAAGIVLLVFR